MFAADAVDYPARARALVAEMTLEEKASLASGRDFWTTKPVERLGVPSIMMTDGPHGLRKAAGAAISDSVPATCFPTSPGLASSWNPDLLRAVGVALGDECQANDVQILLGPGVNMKRSPLGGRNFEYFSEDPLLSGEMAAALIKGVQSRGVGTSLKHFAANNQEYERMLSDSIVDERTLREIYLRAFEIAVRDAAPWTVMCAYNQLNGTPVSQNQLLLDQILRQEWGFRGSRRFRLGRGEPSRERRPSRTQSRDAGHDGAHRRRDRRRRPGGKARRGTTGRARDPDPGGDIARA